LRNAATKKGQRKGWPSSGRKPDARGTARRDIHKMTGIFYIYVSVIRFLMKHSFALWGWPYYLHSLML